MERHEIKVLSDTRFSHAKECLAAAKALLAMGGYKDAVNRSYYAIFHAMRAVLAFDGIDMKHHSDIMAHFRILYIKTGVFDKSLSDIITEAFELRTDSDYDDFFQISAEDAREQVENAQLFLDTVQQFLDRK